LGSVLSGWWWADCAFIVVVVRRSPLFSRRRCNCRNSRENVLRSRRCSSSWCTLYNFYTSTHLLRVRYSGTYICFAIGIKWIESNRSLLWCCSQKAAWL